ncbi:hypothetical protein ACLB2K_011216 [Fragaria x ananassa]
MMEFRTLVVVSAVLRVVLIVYGEWQDTHMEVRYTDIDYMVFSDAASLMASGKSPFERSTYRYSPLLAFLLLPNSILNRSWGKFIFSAADLLVGLFIRTILKLRGVPENLSMISVMAWLFNPFTFTIGTRGNCEPILVLILSFAQDLPFCCFVQTVAFVAFNKVMTAQYFVWFFCLLPLSLAWSNMKLKWKGLSCIALWVGGQLHWLWWGYMHEFKGRNVFLQLWVAGIIFLSANTYVLVSLINHHRCSPVFTQLEKISKGAKKLK